MDSEEAIPVNKQPPHIPQSYLLRNEGGTYILCKPVTGGDGFNHRGRNYDYKTLLYRLETALKLGDTVTGENPTLDQLVKDHAKLLDEIRRENELSAIETDLYGKGKKPKQQKQA